jgi:beta-mannosidase
MDHSVNMKADFYGEFGIACTPCAESVNRYLPDDEKNVWPTKKGSAFEFHTPIFGSALDLSKLRSMVRYFADPDKCTFEQTTIASQLAQCEGLRHTLERARTRWLDCTGALYYKMNDNQSRDIMVDCRLVRRAETRAICRSESV